MYRFFAENAGTIFVAALVAVAVILIIRKMLHDRKNGRTSCVCSCGCTGCPSAVNCRKNK